MTHLDHAQIIIVLVSANLFGEYYNSPEMQHAFQLHKEQKALLVPVIVAPCAWQEDLYLGSLEPLPRGGKPAGLDDNAWLNVVEEINKIARQIQAEQAQNEPVPAAKSSKRKVIGAKPQPLSGAAVTSTAATPRRSTKRPQYSTPRPVPAQPTLPERTLPTIEEPEPATDEARTTAPVYSLDYEQTQNGMHQISFTILIWEPSQSTHELIANERHAIYRALRNERHQCILGSSLRIPEGQSLQDCEINQVDTSDNTVLLIEPQISPMSEWQEFYRNSDDKFRNKVLCYYPETEKAALESWKLDETLYWLKQLEYYQEVEITNCHVRTKVLKFFKAKRLEIYRKSYKSGGGR